MDRSGNLRRTINSGDLRSEPARRFTLRVPAINGTRKSHEMTRKRNIVRKLEILSNTTIQVQSWTCAIVGKSDSEENVGLMWRGGEPCCFFVPFRESFVSGDAAKPNGLEAARHFA